MLTQQYETTATEMAKETYELSDYMLLKIEHNVQGKYKDCLQMWAT
jgi:hypothetical protein